MTSFALGAILIGGSSSRMGSDKALLPLAGVPMVEWVAAALADAGLDVVTVGGPDRIAELPNVADPDSAQGPLAGLAGALEYGEGRPVVLVAVDQPLLRSATVSGLLDIHTHDAVVPVDRDFPQVTCALYRATCLPAIRNIAAVNPDAAIRDLLEYVNVRLVESEQWRQWGEDGRSWRSVDTPTELAGLETELTAPPLASPDEEES